MKTKTQTISPECADQVQRAYSSFFGTPEACEVCHELSLVVNNLSSAIDYILEAYAPNDEIDRPEQRTLIALSEARRILVAILAIFPTSSAY